MGRFSCAYLVFAILLREMANGLDMCKGPYTTPTFEQLSVSPVFDAGRSRWIGADIKLEMTSSVPLKITWAWATPEKEWLVATEDNEKLKSTVEVNGDRYILQLKNRLYDNSTLDVNVVSREHMLKQLTAQYECNDVQFWMSLPEIRKIIENSVRIPTIAELPKKRYIIDDEIEDVTLKFGISQRAGDLLLRTSSCESVFEEKYGTLSRRGETPKVNTTLGRNGDVMHMECHSLISPDLDARVIRMVIPFKPRPGDGPRSYPGVMTFTTEVRRRRIFNRPAVLVEMRLPGEAVVRNGVIVIPAVSNARTKINCLAEGYNLPGIPEVARASEGFERPVKPVHAYISQHELPPKRVAYFELKSPEPNVVEEYMCRAASDMVTTVRFQLLGYIPATLQKKDGMNTTVIFIRNLQSNVTTLNVSCDASGYPTPTIKFYAGIIGFVSPPDPDFFVRAYAQNELHNSDLYDISVTVRGNRTIGNLFVRDVKKAIPTGYWQDPSNYIFPYTCLAYNDLSADTEHLATIFE